jgi:hypothetical protein
MMFAKFKRTSLKSIFWASPVAVPDRASFVRGAWAVSVKKSFGYGDKF